MRAKYILIMMLTIAIVGAWGCDRQQDSAGASESQQEQSEDIAGPSDETQPPAESKSDAGESSGDGVSCLDIEAPPIELPDLQGETVTLEEVLKDKYALLVFWATWCPYCEKEIPALNEMHRDYSDSLEILAIDYQESKDKVQSYAEEQGMKYRILLDEEGKVFQRYGITGTPTLMLVRQNGTICWRGQTPDGAEEKLRELREAGE